MATIFDPDSYYFKVITTDGEDLANLTSSTMSLELTEDIGLITRGNISFLDPDYSISALLPFGREFDLEWGYKKRGDFEIAAKLKAENPKEITNSGFRRGQKCILVTPSWNLTSDGKTVYNATFYSYEYQQDFRKAKVYQSNKRKSVIEEAMANMGVKEFHIEFDNATVNLTSGEYVRQNETNFRFLLRLAYEWHCFFRIAYNYKGVLTGIFVENKHIASPEVQGFVQSIVGGVGSDKLLDYGLLAINPNVINANVTRNIGENGQGDNVTVRIVNGQTLVFRSVTGTNTIKVQRLNEQRLKRFLEKHQEKSAPITKQIVLARSLDDSILGTKISTFFDDIMASTAPQGLGWSIKVDMLGDPTLTPPLEVHFGQGFPADIRENPGQINKYYLKSVTHKIDTNGYRCNLECGDSITVFGGGFVKT